MFLRVRDSVGFGSDQLENKVLTQTGMSWSRLQYWDILNSTKADCKIYFVFIHLEINV